MNHPQDHTAAPEFVGTLEERTAQMKAYVEATNGGRKPKFGDRMRNLWASENNPIRDAFFVRVVHRTGRMNPGRKYEMTDGNGEMWLSNPDSLVFLSQPQQPAGWKLVPIEPTDEMARAGEHWAQQGFDWPKAVYRAMTKVAPAHPAEQQEGKPVPVLAAAMALLVAGGFVTQEKVNEAIQIAQNTPGMAEQREGGAVEVRLQHVAYCDEGKLQWMSGRRPVDCELYAMPGYGRAPSVLYSASPERQQEDANAALNIEAAAKVLAECMDYPWAHMPEEGRANMRKDAQAVIRAAMTGGNGNG